MPCLIETEVVLKLSLMLIELIMVAITLSKKIGSLQHNRRAYNNANVSDFDGLLDHITLMYIAFSVIFWYDAVLSTKAPTKLSAF